MEYRDAADAFKESCKIYLHEKALYEKSDFEHNDLLKQYLEEDIRFVEQAFSDLKEKCGEEAAAIVKALYIDGNSQNVVAETYGISKRKLQYLLEQWFHLILKYE